MRADRALSLLERGCDTWDDEDWQPMRELLTRRGS
jgi:hypothetical protein